MENSQKMVFLKIVCCHGNSLQHTHINEKEIPNLNCEFQELKPKGETNSSFLVLYPSSGVHTVKTVGSHLKLILIEHVCGCCLRITKQLRPVSTSNLTCAESNANERKQKIFVICIKFGSCKALVKRTRK